MSPRWPSAVLSDELVAMSAIMSLGVHICLLAYNDLETTSAWRVIIKRLAACRSASLSSAVCLLQNGENALINRVHSRQRVSADLYLAISVKC